MTRANELIESVLAGNDPVLAINEAIEKECKTAAKEIEKVVASSVLKYGEFLNIDNLKMASGWKAVSLEKNKGSRYLKIAMIGDEGKGARILVKLDSKGRVDSVRGELTDKGRVTKEAKDVRRMSSADPLIDAKFFANPKNVFGKFDNLGISQGAM